MLYTGSLSMESVDSACRDTETRCDHRRSVSPGAAPQVCRAGFKARNRAVSSRYALHTHLQVDDSVCAVALHGVELQVPLEVLGVEPRDGQTVAESSLCRQTRVKEALWCCPGNRTTLWSSLFCDCKSITPTNKVRLQLNEHHDARGAANSFFWSCS